MTFDLVHIQESKRVLSRELAVLPLAEEMRLLDVFRERTLAIHRAAVPTEQVPLRQTSKQTPQREERCSRHE